ncbi:DUF3703 domain-containing protein [Streptomyces nanhaiensis]|uniref:DUF3703 domain-containing protein n=1 Tax=Streptomyces nanhaiensis TaxID=679319 RepID=UPI00399CB987
MLRRTPMPAALRAAYAAELATARSTGPMADRWRAVERAHILSQPWPGAHTRTHAVMLRLAVRDRDLREVLGQLVRLVVAAPGSAAGRYPTGNTGRTRVGLTTPMPIPEDLAALLSEAGIALRPSDPRPDSGATDQGGRPRLPSVWLPPVRRPGQRCPPSGPAR